MKNDEWISVDNELPSNTDAVLVWYYGPAIARLYTDGWFIEGDAYIQGITHWMPLPDAPKKDLDAVCPHCGKITRNKNPNNTYSRCWNCYRYFSHKSS